MKDNRGWNEYSDAELIKAIDDMVEFDADSMTELVKRADLYDQESGILSRWDAEPDGEHDIQDFFDEACEIIKKFHNGILIDSKTWNAIASYMDDDIREGVHLDMAPCSNEDFLREYLKRDPGFAEILKTEFNMEV